MDYLMPGPVYIYNAISTPIDCLKSFIFIYKLDLALNNP